MVRGPEVDGHADRVKALAARVAAGLRLFEPGFAPVDVKPAKSKRKRKRGRGVR